MRRREFITLVGGVAAWPLAVRAQQSAIPIIGFLRSTLPDASTDLLVALRKGLKETSYVEGQNITIEYRWAENRHERLAALAADLVRKRCVVIIAGGVDAAFAAKAATATIPIIFAAGDDPIKRGLAGSLNRPGGNVTGVFFVAASVEGKQLGLLREVVPKAAVIGMLVNPASPGSEQKEQETQAAARAPLGNSFMFSRLAASKILIMSSRPLPNIRLAHSSLGAVHSSPASAINWSRWRRVTLCPRCIIRASSSKLAG
jgi:putative ABC transport system substrate-binding protein